ncbi:putative TIR domain, AAA+ ATPase domain, P-loop containing nucleoside triphosphate hydrolase [Helianthus annuus]|uniref:TIR domain, AAA+ ATPase domain, P-loop containing nucleoside triphosphate hydrolase n=1 Tax=Helianthus annuus TaxID=4232 RepID=A0A9K3IVL6_HELAN|nr:TMV resistance protein N [Helianthus annuus]KAF5803966.1 putative TIR domain, AAA+ ATPase domain, P-loop containing nucleoside triphosphate hydrolase [Helianthus annuus]KAJ0561859.1 putative TIR domain, AAA+ ATPase domain, P-loop containing nucleoside triphosphate hydrolase [Helianthus annuus]KAJ0574924.1 putative TIR domain, AAA+ ATPase domain, P-loop containing nucleoside triphosphate hydrolase [Helianthus annuus]KAJ0913548.1 putative TIR domain, AAA+ ATPase domain, P-loop containing nucle
MAYLKSASCSSSSVSWKYDVFLSFRGEDTRYNFVDHLYAALVQRGLCVFKDDEELKKGKEIAPELLKAIEESRFAVVVFSKNYANSSWCLAELAKIMQWHNGTVLEPKVIPVFYHVDPSDLRAQKNDVAVFFQQHEEKFREEMDKVKEWRDALTATANLSGLHISESFKVGESTYVRKIVEEILSDKPDIQPSYIESNLVGIDSRIEELSSRLETKDNEKVQIVGIHGMGGIGKTTIAKALFRRIKYKFEGSSFVNDVRENSSSKRDICALQEKVLRDILEINQNFNVRDPEDGANMIRTRFVHKKVLMVLDDVDNFKQLEFLAATHDSFGPGSRIIITTRNEQLLSDADDKYKPDFLIMNDALVLFNRGAFKTNCPPEGYEEFSCRAIRYAGYLPLAVKVLGSFFHGRKAIHEWESALNRLAKAPPVDIFKTLKLSFDGLEGSEKNIFLDIACFYKGRDIRDVTRVFESCGFDPEIGINVLVEKSLITISNERICMHDLLQEMGQQIARENIFNRRLWQLEDIHDSLKNNQKLEEIEAIVVPDKQYDVDEYEEKVGFRADVFERMKNLRLLDIRGRFTSCEPTIFPNNLRWLCWSECPFTSLSTTQMSKLVGLQVVGGTVKQFWNGQKIMRTLKYLNLQQLDCLTTLPDVSMAPNIEKLIVSRCTNLVKVHESLGSHKRLVRLRIVDCKRLKRLPSRFEMESLRFLILNNCSSLVRFPDVSPCMIKLSLIQLDYCCSIEALPSSVVYLSSLRRLSFRRYKSHRNNNIPEEHGFGENLVEDNAKALESHPKLLNSHTVINSCSLRSLNLRCRPMESEVFLKNLHAFSCLETLDLSGNNNLIQLPASISHLSRLRKLNLNECHRLQILHSLPSSIQELEANNCYSLEKIDDLAQEYDCSHLSRLRKLNLNECHRLKILHGLPSTIQELEANNCYNLQKIDHQLQEYASWYHISFINCQKLVEDDDCKRYLHKMSQQSFLKRCAVIDRELSIGVPGNKIPTWFKEAQPGNLIALVLPPKCDTQINGIAICGVVPGEWPGSHYRPQFHVNCIKDGMCNIVQKEVDCINNNASAAVAEGEDGNTWIWYRPCRSFGGQDWSAGGTLLISISQRYGAKAVRCAARLIYKEDVESNQQITTCISYPWKNYKERKKVPARPPKFLDGDV